MTQAADDLPRAPRRVRARAAFATWRPFGLVVLVLLVTSVAIAVVEWSEDGFRSPRGDWHLDAAAGDSAVVGDALGTVTLVDRDRKKGDKKTRWARYHFTSAGRGTAC
jgi:hypothetical protein